MTAEILKSHPDARYGKSFLKLVAETEEDEKFLGHMSFGFAQRVVDNADELKLSKTKDLVVGIRFEFKT